MTNLAKSLNIVELKTAKMKLDRDRLNKFLNKEPEKAWIKQLNGIEYIPIEIIEDLMTRIFRVWNVEVKEVKSLFNSVQVTVRVHYEDPITERMLFQDGVGAAPMQVDAGQAAANMQRIKHNAVQIGAPAAKSYAIKDAVEHIGKLFGRDIGRKNALPFIPMSENEKGETISKIILNAQEVIKNAKTKEEVEHVQQQLEEAEILDSRFQLLIATKLTELINK